MDLLALLFEPLPVTGSDDLDYGAVLTVSSPVDVGPVVGTARPTAIFQVSPRRESRWVRVGFRREVIERSF